MKDPQELAHEQLNGIQEESTEQVKAEKQERNAKLGKCIAIALEIEMNFKMYSYRIISPEVFMGKTQELFEYLKQD